MEKIYLDNASTTFPKPECVPQAVYRYMVQEGSNINRGGYASAYQAEEMVFEARELLCELFHGSDCRNVIFTKNVTESINILLKGFLRPGDHILVSSMEHNAVMRPVVQLKQMGVTFTRIPCDETGALCVAELENCLAPNTRAVMMTHASNVCGTILPIERVGEFCKEHGLKFFVDCAQTAGTYPIDMKKMHIDALAYTGHKGLLGPQGIGGFLMADGMAEQITPILSGGTGSFSHMEQIPHVMPDRFEAGTLNLPGIAGLREGLKWLKKTGISSIRQHETELTEYFLKRLLPLEKDGRIRILGKRTCDDRTSIVSIQTPHKEMSEVAFRLDTEYGIMTRVGLHCAPNAHKTIGSFPEGAIRFSFGWWNTKEHVDAAVNALKEII